MSLTNENKKWLTDLTRTGVDDARVTIDCREVNGRFMTVEECEFCLSMITPASKTLWKLFEARARKAFRASVRGEKCLDRRAETIAEFGGRVPKTIRFANYSTLRRALFLAIEKAVCEAIQREIQIRFPWGSYK